MVKLATQRCICSILAVFLGAGLPACATRPLLRPVVQSHPGQFPFNVQVKGLAIAVVPFDGWRDVYEDPANPRFARPDFDWLKAGVRPTRIIVVNESQQAVWLDPSQVSCIDSQGTAHQAYTPREAGDLVVASRAFAAHLKSGLKGALVGAALGAGVGAALGAVGPYGNSAAAAAGGAAWGGAMGGLQGLFLGGAGSRADLERRVRTLMESRQLPAAVLSPGLTRDGLVFFPAVPMQAVRLVLAEPDRQASFTVQVEVSVPPLAPALPQASSPQGTGR
jgi:hypothetical protein